ncbi:uncharacterized protein LOC128995357 [Macrosteles quadrilineatus]|uniref:uncharacterized protein LOC128995357 n=1 Tax=Macrosteles quadrilineatus TaxID=74068 RepID=UPI0023E27090|nr:uncharacterized protein LOC128995357 [Macrosteles quadrilineatus]
MLLVLLGVAGKLCCTWSLCQSLTMLLDMEPNAGMVCIKYILVIFNFLFVVTGICLVLVGWSINYVYFEYSEFLESHFFSPGFLMVGIGILVFAVACFGCLGAYRESTCMITVFSVMLAVIFGLEVAAGLSAYILQGDIHSMLQHTITEALEEAPTVNSSAVIFGLEVAAGLSAYILQGDIHSMLQHTITEALEEAPTFSVMLAVIFGLEVAAGLSAYILQGDIHSMLQHTITEALEEAPTFSVMLAVIFGLEVAAGLSAYILQGDIHSMLQRTITEALEESPTFSVMLAVIFGLEVAAGLSAYILQGDIHSMLQRTITEALEEAPTVNSSARMMNVLQSELHCCGIYSFRDWEGIYPANDSSITLPESCCDTSTGDQSTNCSQVYQHGCLPQLETFIRESIFLLAGTACTIALIQLVGVSFSCSLAKMLRIQKTERDRQRWEMREQLINSYTQGKGEKGEWNLLPDPVVDGYENLVLCFK